MSLEEHAEELRVRGGELMAMAETLRQREARFRALVQNATDIIGLVGSDATIEYVSPSV